MNSCSWQCATKEMFRIGTVEEAMQDGEDSKEDMTFFDVYGYFKLTQLHNREHSEYLHRHT